MRRSLYCVSDSRSWNYPIVRVYNMLPYWLYQIQSHGTLLKWPKVRLKSAWMAPLPLKHKLNMFTPSVVVWLVTAHLFEGRETERVVKEKHLFGSAQAWWQAQPREWEQDGAPCLSAQPLKHVHKHTPLMRWNQRRTKAPILQSTLSLCPSPDQ